MSTPCVIIPCTVRDRGQAYTTNTHKGVRSSSTCGPQDVAERQGRKLLGKGFARAVHVSIPVAHEYRFDLVSTPKCYAWCMPDGAVYFDDRDPAALDGTIGIPFAAGPAGALEVVLEVLGLQCRKTYQLPTVAAADNPAAALKAWIDAAAKGNGHVGRYGCVVALSIDELRQA